MCAICAFADCWHWQRFQALQHTTFGETVELLGSPDASVDRVLTVYRLQFAGDNLQDKAYRRHFAGGILQETTCRRHFAGGNLQEAFAGEGFTGGILQEATCRDSLQEKADRMQVAGSGIQFTGDTLQLTVGAVLWQWNF